MQQLEKCELFIHLFVWWLLLGWWWRWWETLFMWLLLKIQPMPGCCAGVHCSGPRLSEPVPRSAHSLSSCWFFTQTTCEYQLSPHTKYFWWYMINIFGDQVLIKVKMLKFVFFIGIRCQAKQPWNFWEFLFVFFPKLNRHNYWWSSLWVILCGLGCWLRPFHNWVRSKFQKSIFCVVVLQGILWFDNYVLIVIYLQWRLYLNCCSLI